MSHLHQLVAVFDDLKGQSNKVRGDLISTFRNKSHLFGKKVVTTDFLEEGKPSVTDTQSDIQTTVAKEIEWVNGAMAKAIDAGYQIDLGNLQAKADIVIDESDGEPVVLAHNVPATFLLQLEKHLTHIHELASAIPTLDPAKGFSLDTAAGKGLYQARPVTKEKTRKEKKVLVASPATDKHPAQVQVYDADVVIGTIRENEWSSMITPATKAEIIGRIDILLRAVKKARSRANATELDTTGLKIGKKILSFVFEPLQ